MVYVVLMYTLLLQISILQFSQDLQIHEVQVRKSYFLPFEPIESLENLHMARTDLELGKSVSQILCMCPGPSFIAKYNCGRAAKSIANF